MGIQRTMIELLLKPTAVAGGWWQTDPARIGYWPFTADLLDHSGYNQTMTAFGAAAVGGSPAALRTGPLVGAYADATPAVRHGQNYSVLFWMNAVNMPSTGGYAWAFNQRGPGSVYDWQFYILGTTGGKGTIYSAIFYGGGGAGLGFTHKTGADKATWQMFGLSVKYDAPTLTARAFCNGAFVQQKTVANTPNDVSTLIRAGRIGDGAVAPFDGHQAENVIVERTLLDAEVTDYYTGTRGYFGV